MQDVLQKVLLWTPGSVFNPLTVRCNKFLHVIPVEQLSGCVYPRTDGGGGGRKFRLQNYKNPSLVTAVVRKSRYSSVLT